MRKIGKLCRRHFLLRTFQLAQLVRPTDPNKHVFEMKWFQFINKFYFVLNLLKKWIFVYGCNV